MTWTLKQYVRFAIGLTLTAILVSGVILLVVR